VSQRCPLPNVVRKYPKPGPNPTLVSCKASVVKIYNASAVKNYNASAVTIYNATSGLVSFENKIFLFQFEKNTLA
jgi:hypothetical protein